MTVDRIRWIVVAYVLLAALALRSIWRSSTHARKVKLIWSAAVVLIPFIGAIAWIILGRDRRRH